MEQLKYLFSPIPFFALLAISFVVGALYGQQFEPVNWSTITAGVLGLLGGTCAFIATQWERHQKEKAATFRFYEQTRVLLPTLIKYLTSQLEVLQKDKVEPSVLDEELLEYFERMIPEASNDLPLEVIQAHSRLMAVKVGIRTPVSILDQDTDIHRNVLAGAISNSIIFTMELQAAIEKHGRSIRF